MVQITLGYTTFGSDDNTSLLKRVASRGKAVLKLAIQFAKRDRKGCLIAVLAKRNQCISRSDAKVSGLCIRVRLKPLGL